ncbi:ABC transporter ATP-binding protein [Corynebacterium lubricantis]|uniref:ABC transporter ATP-binding protein n=1 Tax=Corynebacterium lubricantis TaxID=541095 RepID=UPI00036AA14C|nr:ABC transporter ATP-binding protein [Corynebacterium lubricantis]
MSILSLNDVTVAFPDGTSRITALDRVSLNAHAGEMTYLVGESGSGKSTLLSVAAGLTRPDSGTVTVADQELTAMKDTAAARLQSIGFIFQQANLISSLNVAEQLLVTDHVRGLRGAKLRARRDRANEILARVGLAGLGDRRMQQLSGGQRQRVGIARALMGEPKLLLADEPTAALDAERSRDIVELLSAIVADSDVACVFVTHDRSLIGIGEAPPRVIEVADGAVKDVAAVS